MIAYAEENSKTLHIIILRKIWTDILQERKLHAKSFIFFSSFEEHCLLEINDGLVFMKLQVSCCYTVTET